nr:hypothetical protein GCM10020092_050630 [Actinoplanes digitatis]
MLEAAGALGTDEFGGAVGWLGSADALADGDGKVAGAFTAGARQIGTTLIEWLEVCPNAPKSPYWSQASPIGSADYPRTDLLTVNGDDSPIFISQQHKGTLIMA